MNLDFSRSPTIWKFLNDDKAFVRGLIGPVGSGKSYACCAEIFRRAVEQKPSPRDGIKYSRAVVVRNSYPMLRTTTLKTWLELFPEDTWGPVRMAPPITHHLKLPAREGAAGIDLEVIFLALDSERDTKKLLSLEISHAFCNESRELPVSVIEALTHRIGRYPTKADGGCTAPGIWLDSNPSDSDSWLHRVAVREPITGKFAWNFYHQPPGVLEATADEVPDKNPEAQGYTRAANKWWKINPAAENYNNLPSGYYQQLLGGKQVDWIKCYAAGQWTYVKEGKPVWPEFDSDLMVSDLTIDPMSTVYVGLDFGLTPAAVFAQRTKHGTWHVIGELVTFSMGLHRFAELLKSEMEIRFDRQNFEIYGDPAGSQRDATYEHTSFEHLKTMGILARPTHSNVFRIRREASALPMTRLIDSKPGLLVDRQCERLIKSLSGGYHFKRVSMGSGQERFKDVPNKNEHSHVGDAFGYCMLGGGEARSLTHGHNKNFAQQKQQTASLDFNVFD